MEYLCSPVIALKHVKQQYDSTNSFNFCSLDAGGNLFIWMGLSFVEAFQTNDMAGSDSDFGLRPGSSVRLIQLARIGADAGISVPRVLFQLKERFSLFVYIKLLFCSDSRFMRIIPPLDEVQRRPAWRVTTRQTCFLSAWKTGEYGRDVALPVERFIQNPLRSVALMTSATTTGRLGQVLPVWRYIRTFRSSL